MKISFFFPPFFPISFRFAVTLERVFLGGRGGRRVSLRDWDPALALGTSLGVVNVALYEILESTLLFLLPSPSPFFPPF